MMINLKLTYSLIKLQPKLFLKNLCVLIFAGFGGYKALIEIINFLIPMFNSNSILYLNYYTIPLILLFSVYKAIPKSSYNFKIKNKDISVELRFGDMFRHEETSHVGMIIPTNTSFTTTFTDKIIMPNSVQGQFTKKYFNDNLDSLELRISKSLENKPHKLNNAHVNTNKKQYNIGETAKVNVNDLVTAYWLAVANMTDSGAVNGSFDELIIALNGLWDYIEHHGQKDTIITPVIGAGKTGIPEPIEELFFLLINSFISYSKSRKLTKKLIVYLLPEDVFEQRIDPTRLLKFLEHQCTFYKHSNISSSTPVN